MSPFDEPPFDPDHAPYSGDEPEVTSWLLDYHRHVLLKKLEGLTETQARQTTGAGDLTLLGLARHLGGVEQYWFGKVYLGTAGDTEAWHYDDTDDPDIDFHPSPDDTLADAISVLHHEIRRARSITSTTPLDSPAAGTREGKPVNLRWIVVHLIEEYARHCGHADLIRESIDGVTGD